MKALKRVLIMAGGTGGHVFPGLAVARFFREKGVDVHWLGTQQGLEARLVAEENIPLHFVSISGVRGKGLLSLFLAPMRILKAILQSRRIIKSIQPDVVIGMGGFVSGPGGVASWLLRCPLLIHEQNAKAGYTNQLLGRIARKIMVGFPSAFKLTAKVIVTGNPVRREIESLPAPQERLIGKHSSLRLLVLGGSLGAQALNDVVPRALAELGVGDRPEVLHQTGEKHFETAKKSYELMGIQANLVPFIKDMASSYAWADVVLCRAGALTVAELCAVGLGAIFVPYPHAVDDHQTANANFMVDRQAACCIQQSDLTQNHLATIVREYSTHPERRLAMAEAAYRLRHVNVVEKIYTICQEVCL